MPMPLPLPLLLLKILLLLSFGVDGFQPVGSPAIMAYRTSAIGTMAPVDNNDIVGCRREFLHTSIKAAFAAPFFIALYPDAAVAASSLDSLVSEIRQARKQMNRVPDLIQAEQWDAVRAILVTPPLSDLWTKSARTSPLLADYAGAVGGTPSGDEFAVLEAKEDVEGHLRFLDMAVYNNVFNPIKSVGETGATKQLIRSYYDDPINEYKASVAALDELIQLGNLN